MKGCILAVSNNPYLIDVRDKFALSWHVDFLIVCPHLALDSKEENLQVSFLRKSVDTRQHSCFHMM